MKRLALLLAFCLGVLFFGSFRGAIACPPPDRKTASSALSSLSVPFIENKGQVDKDVAYYAKTMGATLFVTKTGEMVYGFPHLSFVERIHDLVPQPKGLTLSRTHVSSFTGNDPSLWQGDLSTYTAVSLGETAPGITITLHAYGGAVEKIITISPYTEPSVVITVDGASSLGLAGTGELTVHTDKGDLVFSRPIAYQEINGTRVSVPVAYMLVRTEGTASDLPRPPLSVLQAYSFSLGSYDHSYPLTIDPILRSTYLGGSDYDGAIALALGADGIYVAGAPYSSDFPGTTGGAQPAYGGGLRDAFVAFLSFDLTSLTRATYLGGSNSDNASALVPGADGIYAAGTTSSNNFPGTTGGAQPAHGGGYDDGFVALLSSDLKGGPVVLLSPNGGEVAKTGDDLVINWEADAEAHAFKLLYSTDNGLTWKPITTGTVTGTSYPWTVPPLPRNRPKARVKIKGYDAAGTTKLGSDKSDEPFTIEVLRLDYPNGGDPPFLSGRDITITWTTHATIRPVTQVKLSYSLDNGITWKPFLSQPAFGSDPESYTVQLPTVRKTKSNCKVKGVLKDATGKKVGSDVSDGVFAIEPAPVP